MIIDTRCLSAGGLFLMVYFLDSFFLCFSFRFKSNLCRDKFKKNFGKNVQNTKQALLASQTSRHFVCISTIKVLHHKFFFNFRCYTSFPHTFNLDIISRCRCHCHAHLKQKYFLGKAKKIDAKSIVILVFKLR